MLSAIASFLGLLGSLFSWFTGAQQRKIGRQEQEFADEQAVAQRAAMGQQVRTDAATDSDYAARLRAKYTDTSE